MVKLHDDLVGPTAHLHGMEERSWLNLMDHLDLIDLYFTVVHRKGPIYTRQAIRGGRLHQTRLDRVYSSNRGNWFVQVQSLEHDNRQTLSNHIPVMVMLALEAKPTVGRCKGTYAKLDHTYLDNEDFQGCVQIKWDQAQVDYEGVDP